MLKGKQRKNNMRKKITEVQVLSAYQHISIDTLKTLVGTLSKEVREGLDLVHICNQLQERKAHVKHRQTKNGSKKKRDL
jgi:hypothetical protein